MKKLLAVLLCLVMVLGLLAGCNGGSATPTTTEPKQDPPATQGGNKDTTPATTTTEAEERVTITVALAQSANVEDYDTNAFTLWLEEECNVDIEFMKLQTNAADYKAQVSTMFLDPNADLPDIYWGLDFGDELRDQYGADGYFLDLTPYYDDKEGASAIFWQRNADLATEYPDYAAMVVRKLVREDGKIYSVPTVEVSFGDTLDTVACINQDWLTKLNLPMPTNPDELYDVLVAFKTQDPNGNGKADEIPVWGRADGYCGRVIDWIVNMFTYVDREVWFSVDENNKIYLPYTSDVYREALKYANKLVEEGLMPESVFALTNAEIKGGFNVATKEEQTAGIVLGHPTAIMDNTCPALLSYEVLPYFNSCNTTEMGHSYKTHISGYTEYPEKCFEILMAIHSLEGTARMRLGVYGVDWDYAGPNDFKSEGVPATHKRLTNVDFWGTVHNKSWSSMTPCTSYYDLDFRVAADLSTQTDVQKHRSKLNSDKVTYYNEQAKPNNPAIELPKIVYTNAQNEMISDTKTNLTTFINSCRASFVTGTGDSYNNIYDDAQWAAYIAELDKMGLGTWQTMVTKIYQDMGYAVS